MLFNSLNFILFALIFFPLYHFLQGKYRVLVTLMASYIFYGFFDYRFLFLILFITFVNFFFGIKISFNKKKIFLILPISINLIILGYFKYCNFFFESFYDFMEFFGLKVNHKLFEIILPVGISFFTFQAMSYVIDIYKKKCIAERDFIKFATYIALFPQLVAGPIVRAGNLIKFLGDKSKLSFKLFLKSFELIIYGFFLKLCIADRLAIITERTFSSPESFGGFIHFLSSILFSFQIYADFAGYSLIAIGIGKLMCLRFGTNFRRPYCSTNIQDFWRRWHISLSSWLRDYIYIPLGGNRVENKKIYLNILIVMFLGGLWHGASYNFILWGSLHGCLLCFYRFSESINLDFGIPNFLKIILTFLLVNFLWIFFRSENLNDAIYILQKIFTFENYFNNYSFDLFNLVLSFFVIIVIVIIDFYYEFFLKKYKIKDYLRICFCLVFLWMISFIGVFEGTNFIYFKF